MSTENNVLLKEYAGTAKDLKDGKELSQESMSRFHGMTGLMLVDVYERLWSEDDLRGMMRSMIQQHASECPHHTAAATQFQHPAAPPMPLRETYARAIAEKIGTIVICITIVVSLAIMWKQLPQLGDLLNRARTETTK